MVFLSYLSSLYDIIKKHLPSVKVGGYADDHQLYLSYNPGSSEVEEDALQKMEQCISEVRAWMLTHHLKINDAKTEFWRLNNSYRK